MGECSDRKRDFVQKKPEEDLARNIESVASCLQDYDGSATVCIGPAGSCCSYRDDRMEGTIEWKNDGEGIAATYIAGFIAAFTMTAKGRENKEQSEEVAAGAYCVPAAYRGNLREMGTASWQ